MQILKWKNFIIDMGPHIFHTPDNSLKNFWKKILRFNNRGKI